MLSYHLVLQAKTQKIHFHTYFTHYLSPSLLCSVRPATCIRLSLPPSMAAWDLSVTVEDLGPSSPPVTISVASDLHVGGVILKLVERTRRCHCVLLFV